MKKRKILSMVLALMLAGAPGINSIVPFAPSSTPIEVSAVAVDECYSCMVTTLSGKLALRDRPNINGTVITNIPRFSIVIRKGKLNNGWLKVSYNGYTGYASAAYLCAVVYSCECTHTTKNVTTYLNLREGPGTKYNTVGKIPKGGKFKKLGIDVNGFTKVKYNGTIGWVSKDYVGGAHSF